MSFLDTVRIALRVSKKQDAGRVDDYRCGHWYCCGDHDCFDRSGSRSVGERRVRSIGTNVVLVLPGQTRQEAA